MSRRPEGYEYQSEFARKHFGEGQEKVMATLRATLEELLVERRFVLTADHKSLLRSCNDPALIARWIQRSGVVMDTSEIFDAGEA